MRRGTWLVVGALAAIAIVAGVDALRGGTGEPAAQPEPEPPATTTTEPNRSTATRPFAGVLYYADESCDLRAVELPDVTEAPAPSWNGCRFSLSPDEDRVGGPGTAWDRHSDPRIGRLFQSVDGVIRVATDLGPEREAVEGTAAAWRPNGTLTYFADGAVREWPGGEVLLSQRDLLRAVASEGLDRSSIVGVSVREMSWLEPNRLAAIVALEAPNVVGLDVVAVFDGRRLLAAEGRQRDSERLMDLRTSPNGRLVLARNGIRGDFVLLDARGSLLAAPRLENVRAMAFSPNEQWVAAATDSGVYVFRPGEDSWVARLDIVANDLDWRGADDAGAGPVVVAEEARAWLEGLGATGRLVVTERAGEGCRLRALRLPGLGWEDEPDVPAPCDFTLTPGGGTLEGSVSVPASGDLSATCDEGNLLVFQEGGFRTTHEDACGPAWMGDGTLTFVRRGELWTGVEDAYKLMTRATLAEIFGRPSALEEVAWIDDRRFWAVVRSGESAIVAAMTTERLVFSPTFTTARIEGLRVSATGMVAAQTDRGVVFFDSGGRRALTFPNGRAVAWAPGELYAAVATDREILLVAPVSREVVTLPLAVRDLEWVVP